MERAILEEHQLNHGAAVASRNMSLSTLEKMLEERVEELRVMVGSRGLLARQMAVNDGEGDEWLTADGMDGEEWMTWFLADLERSVPVREVLGRGARSIRYD